MITIQPMRSQNQSYLVLVLVIFPAFEKVTGDCQEFWLVCHTVCSCCDWSECLFGSGFSTVSKWVSVTIEPSIRTLQIFGPMFPDLWNFLWVDISLPFYFPPGDPIDISYSAHIICDPRAGISRWLVKTSWRKAPMKLHFHEVFFTVVFSRNSLFFPSFFYLCLASVSGVLVPGVDVYGTFYNNCGNPRALIG